MIKKHQMEESGRFAARVARDWSDNQGTLLAGFSVGVFLLGSVLIFLKQTTFKPPMFPENVGNIRADVSAGAPVNPEDYMLILVSGAESDQGQMRLALFDDTSEFPELRAAFDRVSNIIESGRSVFPIEYTTLPERFSVFAFHDENTNEALDHGSEETPGERYAVSGGVRFDGETLSESDREQTLVDRPPTGTTLTLQIR